MKEEQTETLDAILSDEPTEEVQAETPVETPEAKTEPEVEKVEKAAQEAPETPETPENADNQPEETQEQPQGWTYAAYADEKAKRQTAQKELEEVKANYARMQAQMNALQYQQQQAQAPKVDLEELALTDPAKYAEHIQQQTLQGVMPQIDHMNQQFVIAQHGQEKANAANEWFGKLSPQEQNVIKYKAQNAPNPYTVLMDEYSAAQEFIEFQNWKAQQGQTAHAQPVQTSPQQVPVQQPNIVTPVTKTPNVGSRNGPKWAGPESLDQILA